MIALIGMLILAFAWLGYETDWMRVRLPIGIGAPLNGHKFKSWEELKPWGNVNFKSYPMWLTHPDNMVPLCGLGWLENTMHIIPEYKVEVKAYGVMNKVTLKEPDSRLLKELATSILKPTRDQRREITAQRRLAKAKGK